VTLNSGTDALIFGLIAAGVKPSDETPPNSFVASTAAIVRAGATPVFADVRKNGLIDPDALAAAIAPCTTAIMPVHLWGGICDMDALWASARRHSLAVVEDATQAMGTRHHNRRAGALGTVGCFSAHPLKIFNALGDCSVITTESHEIDSRARLLGNHGLMDRNTVAEFGYVSRLDSVQAVVLRHVERRRTNAQLYHEFFAGTPIELPREKPYEYHTFVNFVSQCDRRNERGCRRWCTTTPIHLQPAAQSLGLRRGQFPVTEHLCTRILALPAKSIAVAQ
jgi:dTDP-4-amino-4,6-dideoxygalactose transaminase